MVGTKRAGIASGPASDVAPDAKRAKAGPCAANDESSQLAAVAAALDRATAVSEASREMLRMMSWGCLGTPADERHQYQVAVAEMLEEVLASAEQAMQASIDEGSADVMRNAARQSSLCSMLSAANAASGACANSLESLKAAWRKDNRELQVARKALEEEKKKQCQDAAGVHESTEVKDAMVKALQDHQAALSSASSAEPGLHVAAMASAGKRAKLDDGLVNAYQIAASKKPDARSSFDKTVVKQYEDEFNKRLVELKAEIARCSPAMNEHASAVANSEAAFEAARNKQEATAGALRSAECQKWDAQEEARFADDAVKSGLGEVQQAEIRRAQALRELEDFRSGPLEAFRCLVTQRNSAPGVQLLNASMTLGA